MVTLNEIWESVYIINGTYTSYKLSRNVDITLIILGLFFPQPGLPFILAKKAVEIGPRYEPTSANLGRREGAFSNPAPDRALRHAQKLGDLTRP
jgi:hypothetical protein